MTHICSYIAGDASRLPEKTLTLCQGKAKTFRTVHSEVAALSQALKTALGVIPGNRIGLIAKATDDFLQALLAVSACGALAVPINLRWSIQETAAALDSVAAEVLFIDADLVRKYHSVLAERHCIVLSAAEGTGITEIFSTLRSDRRLHNAQDMTREHMGAPLDLQTSDGGAVLMCFTSGTSGPPKGVVISHTSLHCQAMAKLHVVGYREDDVYLHCAPLFHIGGLSSMVAMLAVGATQVFQPVFTAAETLSLIQRHSVTSLIAVPAMIVSLHEASQADRLMQHQQAAEPVPSSRGPSEIAPDWQLSKVRSSRRKTGRPGAYPSVRVVLLGGGELPARLKGPLQTLFPSAHLSTAYGMTEACSSMTFAPIDMQPSAAPSYRSDQAAGGSAAAASSAADSGAPQEGATHQSASGYLARSDSKAGRDETRLGAGVIPVGWPPPGIEMAIAALSADASSTRRIIHSNTPAGEILTRGPHVMLGYWGNPEASMAARLPGGWLCTGDLGQIDARGCLWLLGRIKDTVRSGGENVSAAAVERVLLQVPGVAAAAVVGLPHDRLGEQVSALLELDRDIAWSEAGEADEAELQQLITGKDARLSSALVRKACKQCGLSAFMVPRVVLAQHAPLPTNASGKLLKHAVREIMLARVHQSGPASRM